MCHHVLGPQEIRYEAAQRQIMTAVCTTVLDNSEFYTNGQVLTRCLGHDKFVWSEKLEASSSPFRFIRFLFPASKLRLRPNFS